MRQFCYKAYGLIFDSELQLPELIPSQGAADIIIRLGEVPETLLNGRLIDEFYQVGRQQFLLTVEEAGRYLVRNGNEIIIQPAPNSIESDVRLFLLGSCLGALLHQRGMLAIHASSIETRQGAVLFTGHSGCGKSTLLAAFLQRGYEMLADDITAISTDGNGVPMVFPALPRSKLWADAAEHLGHDPVSLIPLRPDARKYALPTRRQFSRQPVPLGKIFLLDPKDEDELSIEKLEKMGGFQVLLDHTYREQFLGAMETREAHLQMATAAASQSTFYRVLRPATSYQLLELADLIEDYF